MTITFDIETTGLVGKDLHWETDYEQFPHIVQIAWIRGDTEEDHIIRPDGYEIPQEAIDIHGISQAMAKKEGIDIKLAIKNFLFDAYNCETLVGHNIYFDISIIKANALRLGINKDLLCEILHKDKRYDTMFKSMKTMGVSKWPKLTELHEFLFGNEPDASHNAMGDARATLKCYNELIGGINRA